MKTPLPLTLALSLLLAPAAFAAPVTCPQCGHTFDPPAPQGRFAPEDGRGVRGPMPDRLIERYDANSDGQLSLSELPEEPRAQALAEADTDGDQVISQSELQTFLEANRPNRLGPDDAPADGTPRRAQLIERLDTNGDGVVQVSELPEGPRAQALAAADTDGDGILSAEELQAHRPVRDGDQPRGDRPRDGQGRQGRGPADPPLPQF